MSRDSSADAKENVRGEAVLVARPTGTRKRSYVCMAPVPQPGPDGCRNGKLRVIAEPLEDHIAKMVMTRYLEPGK